MDANNMDIKVGTGTRHINILSSEYESAGDASTTNIIIPYVNGGSVSSHNLHPELSPSNRKREEERKEEENQDISELLNNHLSRENRPINENNILPINRF